MPDDFCKCMREDPDSGPGEGTCPSRALQGPLTAENWALFEGLMLMWDEGHQAAKEVNHLSNRIEKLEEAIELLLEKDSDNDLGLYLTLLQLQLSNCPRCCRYTGSSGHQARPIHSTR